MAGAPRESDTTFIVCDDVRSEVGDKISILGFFPADITVESADPRGAIPSLGFVFVAPKGHGLLGDRTFHFRVRGPDGNVVATMDGVPEFADGKATTLCFLYKPFVLGGFGDYLAELEFPSRTYRHEFNISASRK